MFMDIRFVAEELLAHLNDIRERAGAYNSVYLRHLLQELILISLRETPCGNKELAFTGLFKFTQLNQCVDRLLFGGINKTAGIYDDYLSLLLIACQFKACIIKQTKHDL